MKLSGKDMRESDPLPCGEGDKGGEVFNEISKRKIAYTGLQPSIRAGLKTECNCRNT
jgi:hypothetical protein